MTGQIRSMLIGAALFLYNAIAFMIINVVMWRNHVWNEKKWESREKIKNCPPKNIGGRVCLPVASD